MNSAEIVLRVYIRRTEWSRVCQIKFSLSTTNKIILVIISPTICYSGFSRTLNQNHPLILFTDNSTTVVPTYKSGQSSDFETNLWKCARDAPSRKSSPFISLVISRLKVSATRFKSISLLNYNFNFKKWEINLNFYVLAKCYFSKCQKDCNNNTGYQEQNN